ncbi:MAG TPA: CidA/LrgA family protein [Candidatus Limnocylindria bacterium]|nr:CidA/LrgA family protein [Candidatus Limnocylindria bacterium]
MKNLFGFLVILLCLAAGNLVSMLLGLPFPGSIIGMLLLLSLLLSGAVKPDTVEKPAMFLVSLMTLFVLPGAVNLMNVFSLFEGVIPQLLLIIVASTLLTILASSATAQRIITLREKRGKGRGNA